MKKILFLLLMANCSFSVVNTLFAQRLTITTERIEVTNELDAHPDQRALDILARYKPAVDSIMTPVIGESLTGMSGGRPESLLSNWVSDVLVEFSSFEDGKPADMGLCNMGGLRNNMPKGTVHRGDIILISPFNNRLCIAHLKGSDLLALFRDIAAVHGEGVSREVRMVITPDGQLVDAKVGGKPIDPQRVYRIATLDYLAEGNDHLYSLKKALRVSISELFTRDCLMESVQRHSPITSAIEGRITLKE